MPSLALPAGAVRAVPMGLAAWAFEMEPPCAQRLDEGVERIIERLQSLKKTVFGLEGRGSVIRPFNITATEVKGRCPASPRSGLDLLAELLAEHITPAVEPATTKALSLEYTGPRDPIGRPVVLDGLSRGAPQSKPAYVETHTAVEDTKVWPSAKQLCAKQEKRLHDATARGELYQQQELQLAEWFGRWWGRDTEHLEGQSLAPAPAVTGEAAVVAASIEYAPRWWEFKGHSVEQSPLTEMFKLKPGEWECGVCMTRNTPAAKVKCASCSAFRFGASAALNRRGAGSVDSSGACNRGAGATVSPEEAGNPQGCDQGVGRGGGCTRRQEERERETCKK